MVFLNLGYIFSEFPDQKPPGIQSSRKRTTAHSMWCTWSLAYCLWTPEINTIVPILWMRTLSSVSLRTLSSSPAWKRLHQFLLPWEVFHPAHAEALCTRVLETFPLWASELSWKKDFQNRIPWILNSPGEFWLALNIPILLLTVPCFQNYLSWDSKLQTHSIQYRPGAKE